MWSNILFLKTNVLQSRVHLNMLFKRRSAEKYFEVITIYMCMCIYK